MKTRELQNTGITKKQSVPSEVMDLGSMITTNIGMLEGDNEDDASEMTGSTKKSETNRKIDISDIFFDTDTATDQHPTNKRNIVNASHANLKRSVMGNRQQIVMQE